MSKQLVTQEQFEQLQIMENEKAIDFSTPEGRNIMFHARLSGYLWIASKTLNDMDFKEYMNAIKNGYEVIQ